MPHDGENVFRIFKNERTISRFLPNHFPDTEAVIPNLVEDFFKNPTSYLVTMKCS